MLSICAPLEWKCFQPRLRTPCSDFCSDLRYLYSVSRCASFAHCSVPWTCLSGSLLWSHREGLPVPALSRFVCPRLHIHAALWISIRTTMVLACTSPAPVSGIVPASCCKIGLPSRLPLVPASEFSSIRAVHEHNSRGIQSTAH